MSPEILTTLRAQLAEVSGQMDAREYALGASRILPHLPRLLDVADMAQMLVDHMDNGRAMVPSDVDRLRSALAALNAPAKEGES